MPKGIYKHKKGIYHHSKKTKRKIGLANSIALKGKKQSEESNRKRSKSLKGRKNSLGYRHTKEWKDEASKRLKKSHQEGKRKFVYKKISETKKKIWKGKSPFGYGSEHPNWNNGSSFEPYSVDWTDDLKRAIRKRDKYTCQLCGKEPAIIVHHIDYDKKNCNSDNLIILCDSCHGKTNFNRKFWVNYFKKLIN